MALEFMTANSLPVPCDARDRRGRKHALECPKCSAVIKHIGVLYVKCDEYVAKLTLDERDNQIHEYKGTTESLNEIMIRSWDHLENLEKGVFGVNVDDRNQAFRVFHDVQKYVNIIIENREPKPVSKINGDNLISLSHDVVEVIDSLKECTVCGLQGRLNNLYDIGDRIKRLLSEDREEPKDDQRHLMGPKGPIR